MTWQSSAHLMTFPNAILHVDGDGFFASCEQALNPKYKGKPVVTGKERGIASAMSYEAKAKGVKRGMTIGEIKSICPEVIFLPSDYESYSLFSKRMFSIMHRFTNSIEEYGIDEGFANITGMRRPLNMSYPEIAAQMKKQIQQELGISVSVGLAPTKVLAKVASKLEKPDGLVILPGRDIKKTLKNVAVIDIWGVGYKTATYMNSMGIDTALDFILKDWTFIKNNFTKPHQEMYEELNGRAVYKVKDESKTSYCSISKTKTFTPASNNKSFVYSQLIKNLENACIKARRYNLVTKRVYCFLKTKEFRFAGLEAKITRATSFPNDIVPIVNKMFKKIFDPNNFYRSTGIVLSDLDSNIKVQGDLFEPEIRIKKLREIYGVIDKLSSRYGKHTVHCAASLPAMKTQHAGDRADLPSRQKASLKGERGRRRLGLPVLSV